MNDGGPAFPTLNGAEIWHDKNAGNYVISVDPVGMTLRDYFAAKALQGLLASGLRPHDEPDESGVVRISKLAYKFADAMIKVLE
jgi:hypothetical protein